MITETNPLAAENYLFSILRFLQYRMILQKLFSLLLSLLLLLLLLFVFEIHSPKLKTGQLRQVCRPGGTLTQALIAHVV